MSSKTFDFLVILSFKYFLTSIVKVSCLFISSVINFIDSLILSISFLFCDNIFCKSDFFPFNVCINLFFSISDKFVLFITLFVTFSI